MNKLDETVLDYGIQPSRKVDALDLDSSIIDLSGLSLEPSVIYQVPANIASRRQILPCCELKGEIIIAVAHFDLSLESILSKYFKRSLKFIRVPADQLREKISFCYGPLLDSSAQQDEILSLSQEIMHAAYIRNASDIHLDPQEKETNIKFRVDGNLEIYKTIPAHLHLNLISRFKILSGMNIAEKRSPQDGKFQHILPGEIKLDVRCATICTKKGEKITMRIIGVNRGLDTLDDLGLSPQDKYSLTSTLSHPHGLIIVAGATGSGKSTTLYTCIKHLMTQGDYNIITIEDPVEYEIENVSQVEIQTAEKVTFASALRSVLRHDPDIIMVGEIRDTETADIAVKASLTGHLVFSTLHANSASSVITRLQDMGIEPYLVGSTLRLSIAQRLMSRLCPHCSQPYVVHEDDLPNKAFTHLIGKTFYTENGCLHCNGKGNMGRVAVFEMIKTGSFLGDKISKGINESEIQLLLKERKLDDIYDDMINKGLQRLISWETICFELKARMLDEHSGH